MTTVRTQRRKAGLRCWQTATMKKPEGPPKKSSVGKVRVCYLHPVHVYSFLKYAVCVCVCVCVQVDLSVVTREDSLERGDLLSPKGPNSRDSHSKDNTTDAAPKKEDAGNKNGPNKSGT